MKILIKKAVQGLLKRLNLWVMHYDTLQELEDVIRFLRLKKINWFKKIKGGELSAEETSDEIIQSILKSKSENQQDTFVLRKLNCKKKGYFVEFGACDGVRSSNTHLLEKEYGWEGILSEPARCWHKDLHKNRNCHIETQAVWKKSGQKLAFYEKKEAMLSGFSEELTPGFDNDFFKAGGQVVGKYEVESISLMDLLEKYNAPEIIDYISIDTEGSEWEVLKDFDFNKYQFRTITCEGVHVPQKDQGKIHQLLTKQGYARKYKYISEIDDWYVKESLL